MFFFPNGRFGNGKDGLVGSLCNRPTHSARLRCRTTASSGMRHITSSCMSYMHVYLATRGCRCMESGNETNDPLKSAWPDQSDRRRSLCIWLFSSIFSWCALGPMHDMGPISCHIYFVTTWSRGEELPHKCSILAFEKPVVVSCYIFMFDAMHNLI